jgi:hypothetical protein
MRAILDENWSRNYHIILRLARFETREYTYKIATQDSSSSLPKKNNKKLLKEENLNEEKNIKVIFHDLKKRL